MEEIKQIFKKLVETSIINACLIVDLAEKLDFTNEQFYIDWEDKLNKLSIKDHNK